MEFPDMEVKTSTKDNYTVLQLKGSLDIYTSLDLKASIDNVTISKGKFLVFDLNHVDYVDSSGIGTLIKIVNQVQEAEGEFFITGLKPMIEKIFKVAGLMTYFTILTHDEYEKRFPLK